MNNLILIKILLNKSLYLKYRDFIKTNALSDELKIIIKVLDFIYKNNLYNNNTETISKDFLIALLEEQYNKLKNKDTIKEIINNIYNIKTTIEEENIILLNNLKNYYLEKIITESINLLENTNTVEIDGLDKYLLEYKNYQGLLIENNDWLVDYDVDTLLEIENDSYGYDWFCEELSEVLGKIKGGDLGLVVASVNTGKTAFILTIAMSLLKQGAKVLHINNEERGSKVKLRALENYLDINKFQIFNNKELAQDVIDNVFKDNYFLYDIPSVGIRDVKLLVKKHNPDVLLIDQAWKVKVSKQDRNDLTLTEVFRSLREIAKEYDIHILGTTQADSDGYDKEYLKMHNLFGSKVGVQGEMDYIIGIGKKDIEASKDNWRYITFPKNKLTGNESNKVILFLDKSKSKYVNQMPPEEA